MTPQSRPGQPLEELRYALAEADTDEPPIALRSRVVQSATDARSPGLAVGTGPAIGPVEAYRRTMVSFDRVLAQLTDDEWHRHVLRDLDIQGLIGHLIGVERQLHAALGMAPEGAAPDGTAPDGTAPDGTAPDGRAPDGRAPDGRAPEGRAPEGMGPERAASGDHVASTQADAQAQGGRSPRETHAEWLDLMAGTVAHAASLSGEALARPITLHTFTVPVERMLVLRAFETWTHEEDIRRATGRPLAAPDPPRLRLMTDLAVSALPAGLDRIGRPQRARTARIVLTGPGGGTWQASLDRGVPGATDVRIVTDAVSFCRLVANRLPPEQLDAAISGDTNLAADLLAGAQALALD